MLASIGRSQVEAVDQLDMHMHMHIFFFMHIF